MFCPICSLETSLYPCPQCGWKKTPQYPMLSIKAQSFWMGSPENEIDRDEDEQLHEVVLHQSFCIGQTEVSQELYHAVLGENPSAFTDPRKPVEQCSWFDAIQFCNAYSMASALEPVYRFHKGAVEFLRTANGYRLPTEAEWELVARLHSTPTEERLKQETHAIEESGLIVDLNGNVWEYCWDFYAPYPDEKQIDPIGPSDGTHRVIRGGSWLDQARTGRPANRGFVLPDQNYDTIGFRLARNSLT